MTRREMFDTTTATPIPRSAVDLTTDFDPVFAAIERHLAAEDRYGAAASLTDEVAANQAARKVSKADKVEFAKAEKATMEAERCLYATPPTTAAGIRALITHTQSVGAGDETNEMCLDAIFRSPVLDERMDGVLPQSETDPVVKLGRRLGDVMKRDNDYQEQASEAHRAKDGSRATYHDNAVKYCYDERLILRGMIGAEKATSLMGAAIQVAEAHSRIDSIRDQFPEAEETFYIKFDFRLINRLLYSVITLLEDVAGQKIADIVDEDFSGEHMNPWLSPEARLAIAHRPRGSAKV